MTTRSDVTNASLLIQRCSGVFHRALSCSAGIMGTPRFPARHLESQFMNMVDRFKRPLQSPPEGAAHAANTDRQVGRGRQGMAALFAVGLCFLDR